MSEQNAPKQVTTLEALLKQVEGMDPVAKANFMKALGIEPTTEKLFWVEEKAGFATFDAQGKIVRAAKPYKVMRIKNAKAQLSLSTFKLIVDNLEAFAEAGKGF